MRERVLSPSLHLSARLRWLQRVFLATALLATFSHVLSPSAALGQWPWSGWFGDPPAVGTPDWWKQNKRRAVFEPGQGYKVEGVEGYFDQDGRPIAGPVADDRVRRAGREASTAGLLPGLDPRVQYDRVKSAVGLGPSEQAARDAFAEGDRLFRAGNYGAASKKFAEAAERGQSTSVEQDALFMRAESYFFDDRYLKARDAYNALVKEYPSTRYMDTLIERQWTIARYWEQYQEYDPRWPMTPNATDKTRPWFDTIGHAIKTYENIRLNDPTGPRADDAVLATANIYFRRRRYDDADYHYTLLRREYPRSKHQFEAHLLGLQAKMRKYQGPDYDGTPLEEAKVLVKQLRQQFAGQLNDEERERLRTVEAQLNHQLAMQDYNMAQHYDNTNYYRAARMYYAKVIRSYPNSELAQQARERVAQIADEPDEPPRRLAWLIDRFPQSEQKARIARIPELQEGGLLVAESPSERAETSAAPPASTTAR